MKLIFSVFVLILSEHFHVCSFLIQESLEEKEWEVFKQTHGKNFENAVEENYRKQTYFNNKLMILNYHLEHGPQPDFTLNLNTFGDLMHSEFISQRNGFFHKAQKGLSSGSTYIPAASVQIPDEVDWRILGAVSPIKDQGNCGSCWAFSATGSLEGQHFRKAGKLVPLSEQNLVDCSGKFGNNGCNGGLMNNAFTYVQYNKGIDTEASYPYKAKDGKCKFSNATVGAICTGYVDLPQGNETALKIAVATIGPISVAIDASPATFQFYHSGIYYDEHCSSVDLDHGVLVVGYGNKYGKDYWIIKNSWGTTWGEAGYFYLARNKHNHCGVATSASFPLM